MFAVLVINGYNPWDADVRGPFRSLDEARGWVNGHIKAQEWPSNLVHWLDEYDCAIRDGDEDGYRIFELKDSQLQ